MAGALSFTVDSSEVKRLRSDLRRMTDVLKDPTGLYQRAGSIMVDTVIPMAFRNKGYPGVPWAPVIRDGRDASPLRDTGALLESITFKATTKDLVVGAPATFKRAKLHQYGGTIVPTKAKWLAIPVAPPLSPAERRAWKPRTVPGGFLLMKGPEGPGIYRLAAGQVTASNRFSRGSSKYNKSRRGDAGPHIERVFAFVKSVKITKRPFLMWSKDALTRIGLAWMRAIASGRVS